MNSLFPSYDHFNKPLDPCAGRHKGSQTSREAFERAKLAISDDRLEAYEFIARRGQEGATSKEVAQHLGKTLNAVSGRCSELRHAGLVIDSKRRRDGCAVLTATK